MSRQIFPNNMVGFELRIIFRDTQAIDLTKMAEAAKKSMFDMMRIHVDKIKLKKYGIKMLGKGAYPGNFTYWGKFLSANC